MKVVTHSDESSWFDGLVKLKLEGETTVDQMGVRCSRARKAGGTRVGIFSFARACAQGPLLLLASMQTLGPPRAPPFRNPIPALPHHPLCPTNCLTTLLTVHADTSETQSHAITLGKGSQESGPFKAKSVDTFNVRAADFAELRRVHISGDYSGALHVCPLAGAVKGGGVQHLALVA